MVRKRNLRWVPLQGYTAVAAVETGWTGPPKGVTWHIQAFSGYNANRAGHFALLHRSDPSDPYNVVLSRLWSNSVHERWGTKNFNPPVEVNWPEQIGWYFAYATIGDTMSFVAQGWEEFLDG